MNETKTNLNADKGRRIVAHLIDNVLIGTFIIISSQLGDRFLVLSISLFYYFILEVIFDRTLGKLVMGIMVIDAKREHYNEKRMFKLIFIRTLCRCIPFDLISFFFTDNGQLWHDNISNTKVILKKSLSKTYFSGETNVIMKTKNI